MTFQIAVDVGGTFTDLVLRDSDGRVRSFKSPTTPNGIVGGILNGLDLIADEYGMPRQQLLAQCSKFACGTTVATNAILERTYARTGLICTEGFRDTLLIREGGKHADDATKIAIDFPEPYIPRHLTIGLRERINSEGGIEIKLDEADVVSAIAQMKELEVDSIAVALLWSIANPIHEILIGKLIEKHWQGMPYSLSHRTSPTLREYRRTSATAIDASLKPLVKGALGELEETLRNSGLSGVLTVITSAGGQTASDEAVERPISLCLSGPSAAPEAACNTMRAESAESCNAIVVDMGGTSFDISIIDDWKIPIHREGVIAGHVFGVPSVEVKTVGSGGGSIARVDAGGLIHVGPESAKSIPGPACYGRGGARPTVTDANLVRGLLDEFNFAGGTMTISREKAVAVISKDVAEPLDISIEEAASLISFTVEQNMVAAIEEITIRRGIDPREYVLVAGGAAAGLHAVPIARELGMKKVMVPPIASVLSAYGILVSDIKTGFSHSLSTSSDNFDYQKVNALLAVLDSEARTYLERMKVPEDKRELRFSAEVRYRGQVWQLTLHFDGGHIDGPAKLEEIVEAFHRLHEKLYFVRSADPLEFTEWSVMAIGRVAGNQANKFSFAAGRALPKSRAIYMREIGGKMDVPVYDFSSLTPGEKIAGPAIIDQSLTSVVLFPLTVATMSETGSLWIDLE